MPSSTTTSAHIAELHDKRAALVDSMKAILDAADANNDGNLTDEQATEYDKLNAEYAELGTQVEAAEKKAAADKQRRADFVAIQADQRKGVGRVTQPDPIIPKGQIVVHPPNAEESPTKGFDTPRDFIFAVVKAGRHQGVDERLEPLATTGSDEQSTFADPFGGFLVPVGFSPDFLQIDAEADPMGGRTTVLPMETPVVKIPARVDKTHSTSVSGGLVVTRKAEGIAGTASRMKVEQVTLTAHSLFGLSYVTEELLTDSPISFAALLAAGFQDEFTSHIIDERLNGTGVGEFLGINNSPALVSVTKETGQAADTLVYENIIKMRSRCWRYGDAIWLANHDTIPQLMLMNQAVGTGGQVVWQPSAVEDHPDILLGRPIIFTEYTKTLGDKGDIVLGNWTQFLEGTFQPLQSAESIHVRFIEHERTFKFWLRNAGTPWWSAALTPKNSTNTLSPFVVVNAR